MNTREQFGKYLLLKKLAEDPLGETFRAGMLGAKGMERVVLLRVLNGQGIDGQRLWAACAERKAVQQALRSPNIGEGVEMGELQGIPYVAYDYVSGKNLTNLLEQAARKQNFVPTEHALLITERIALALALAAEHRFQDQRIHHGFLVPHLVMISNEGETRLLGFEIGTGLRGFAGNPLIRQHFGRYLAPEVHAGAAPDKADDIFSLGVILYELLTGRPLPAPGADGFGAVVDQAQLATEGTPLPADLAQLLKRSLVPRGERIDDVVSWHKALNRWMFEGQYNPTTFNLAFFMHNLFRQEIERESQEIEIEKTLPLPTVASSAATQKLDLTPTAGAAVPTPPPQQPTEATGSVPTAAPAAEPEAKKGKGGILALAAILVLAVGAAIAFFMLRGGSGDGENQAASQPAAELLPAQNAAAEDSALPPAEPEPTGPTPEELQAQIDALIQQRTSDMESQLRQNFDQQIKDLEGQLQDARDASEAREAELAQREQELAEQTRLAELAAEEEAKKQAELAQAAEEEEAKQDADASSTGPDAAAGTPATTDAVAQAGGTGTDGDQGTEEQVAEVEPAAPPAPPPVRKGELVNPGPGVVAPRALRRAQARFPEMARRLGKRGGTVTVRALVDENGRVLRTEVAKKLGFGFDAEAVQAVKSSTYAPATKYGVAVKMWLDVKVVFQ